MPANEIHSVPEPSIGELRKVFRGELLQPADAAYDAARKVHNGMIDRHPKLIARCCDVADVMAAVRFGRERDMLTAVRGGGHNAGGFGVCDNGLVIDLSRLKGIRVDPAARTVRVEGGCVWADVDHATHAFGMATPSGTVGSTGVAGLTLGGGIGHLTRTYGLTIDNLLSADMVLADGSFVATSEKEHPDLFWAIRGGGGNFGVVTSFLFRLHPVSVVSAGPTFWPLDQAPQVIRAYREFIAQAPEDVSGFLAFMNVPPVPLFPEHLHNQTVCAVIWCSTATPENAEKATKPMRSVGQPLLDHVGPMPFPALQTLFDPLLAPGLQMYWRADFLKELSDASITVHQRYAEKIPAGLSLAHMYPINGATQRVDRADTAFRYRDCLVAGVIVGIDPDPKNKETITAWTKEYFDALHPFSAGGAYVNFMMDEGQDRIRASFGENYDRLARIKKTYDPSNFFRVNQNIRPA
ncbi:MAG TPA: FAD-binding oxidoreductase [Terracidiphilus sp.]|nr:FAD-binding oxidoreductase [Terracidiphilus sp.]